MTLGARLSVALIKTSAKKLIMLGCFFNSLKTPGESQKRDENLLEETYLLANGVKNPKIGFGNWMIADNAAAATAVHEAIDAGYRHIDTAEA